PIHHGFLVLNLAAFKGPEGFPRVSRTDLLEHPATEPVSPPLEIANAVVALLGLCEQRQLVFEVMVDRLPDRSAQPQKPAPAQLGLGALRPDAGVCLALEGFRDLRSTLEADLDPVGHRAVIVASFFNRRHPWPSSVPQRLGKVKVRRQAKRSND